MIRYLKIVAVAVLMLVGLAAVVHAQDGTDKTGILGPVIDRLFLPAVALAQSFLSRQIDKAASWWRKLGDFGRWGALYALGLVLTFIGMKLGLPGVVDGNGLTVTGVSAAVPTVVAALIYRFGSHRVPA